MGLAVAKLVSVQLIAQAALAAVHLGVLAKTARNVLNRQYLY